MSKPIPQTTLQPANQSMERPQAIAVWTALALMAFIGCSSSTPRWVEQPWTPAKYDSASSTNSQSDSLAPVSNLSTASTVNKPALATGDQQTTNQTTKQTTRGETVRGQDYGYGTPQHSSGAGGVYVPPKPGGTFVQQNPNYSSASPNYGTQFNTNPQQTFQVPGDGATVPQIGSPNEGNPYLPTGGYTEPYNYADIDVMLREAQTGKITFGAAYNSNSGLVGQIILDERNFDIANYPRGLDDIINGTAWRGAGQGFRMELVPGSEVQRYAVSFEEPYLFNSPISFSASGYFFDRQYFDWSEQRLGGRLGLGYRLTPDLSLSVGLRMENVNLRNPRVNTSPSLNAALGDSALYLASVSLINDTRDHPFMASEGSYLELSYHQGFGDWGYPRGDLDYRKYFLIYQRPDGSGRHTVSLQTRVGVSGNTTPIFENYQVGGFSSMRGFAFRGASPVEGGVRVGGRFQWLNTAEYTFPITADDMFKGVVFCDYGTVEQEIKLDGDNFRVAPGFGFRVHMPVGGAGGAPLAFDFAFPVTDADTDDRQIFSFYMGVLR